MSAKKDPASMAVQFFQTAPIEHAAIVLRICKEIVTRREPTKTKRARRTKAAAETSLLNGHGID